MAAHYDITKARALPAPACCGNCYEVVPPPPGFEIFTRSSRTYSGVQNLHFAGRAHVHNGLTGECVIANIFEGLPPSPEDAK